jgi:uncharacterized RDD family membrane protein YckC
VTLGPGTSSPPVTAARFVTGEAVSFDLQVARLGSRMLARLIDLLVQLALAWLLAVVVPLVFALLELTGLVVVDFQLAAATFVVLLVLVVVGYPVALETFTGGRTLGKLALGLRVVRDDGGPIRFRQALTRALVAAGIEWPGLLAPPLTWLACVWTMTVSRQGKRLGDYAAGTLVIHDRTPAVWGHAPFMPPGLAGWAATLDLAGVDDDLALAVRHFLARVRQLREPARAGLAHRLAAEVAAVTRPAPPPGLPAWVYLAAVHAERHRRARHRLAALRARSVAVWPELAAAATGPHAPVSPTATGVPSPPVGGLASAPPVGGVASAPLAGTGASAARLRPPAPRPPEPADRRPPG